MKLEHGYEPIPGYVLIERLGQGGFGEVWKAEAPGGLPKAIKLVYGNLMDLHDKTAKQELKALNRVKSVHHPFLLGLERVDIIDGSLIIVMELADRDLTHRLAECRTQGQPGIPRDELLGYMAETAEALDLMNIQHNLQHLDVKPQNLFLVRNHIKVADFGLAKDLEGMTASLSAGMTPIYASPETFDSRVSRFSDQYSLAIVYQEMLTGQRPYKGTSAQALMMQHVVGTPDLSPLPEQDREIVGRALAKKPDERFASCLEFVQALQTSKLQAKPAAAPTKHAAKKSEPLVAPPINAGALYQEAESGPPAPVPSPSKRSRAPDKLLGPEEDAPDSSLSETIPYVNHAAKTPTKKKRLTCPRCGETLLHRKPVWCLKCGYTETAVGQPAKPEKQAGGKAEEKKAKDGSFTLTWQRVMVLGMVGIGIFTMLVDFILPQASLVRTLWSVAQLLAGLAGLVAAHVIAMRIAVACSNGELTLADVLAAPRAVWAAVVQELPKSRWPIMLTFWAASLALGAVLLGFHSWLPAPSGEDQQAQLRRALEEARKNEQPKTPPTTTTPDKFKGEPEIPGKPLSADRDLGHVVIAGYVPDPLDSNQVASVVLGTVKDGKITYAGTTSAGFTNAERDELRNRLKSLARTTTPNGWDSGAAPNAVWLQLNPKMQSVVDHAGVNTDGTLKDARFRRFAN